MRFPSTTRVRLAAIAAAALLLSGCVAEMVEKQKPRKGPVPEIGYIDVGRGEIRYSAEGWGFIVATRRMTAIKRINRFCRKDLEPKIVDEFTHDDVDTAYAGMDASEDIPKGLDHYQVAPYHHIVFECVAKKGVQTVDEIARAKAARDEAKAKAAAEEQARTKALEAAAAEELAKAKTVKERAPEPQPQQAPAPALQAPAPALTPPPGEPPK